MYGRVAEWKPYPGLTFTRWKCLDAAATPLCTFLPTSMFICLHANERSALHTRRTWIKTRCEDSQQPSPGLWSEPEGYYQKSLAALCNAGDLSGLRGIHDRPRRRKMKLPSLHMQSREHQTSCNLARGELQSGEMRSTLVTLRPPKEEGRRHIHVNYDTYNQRHKSKSQS
ncbi:1991_t:CDS:2, partial [Scutellospora calospora]